MQKDQYNHKKIEQKWQKRWLKDKVYKTLEPKNKKEQDKKEKFYVLDMFPYPSGVGLHVGHPKGYIATDIVSRMKRMQGKNILHPMGFDAFGLPAEQFALKNKVHPEVSTNKNIKYYKEQLAHLGFDYDWSREVVTTDPKYYKWTQWAFLQMYKKGLVFESHEPINWCPSCKTGLANEDLEDGLCERCGSVVEKKPIRQWVIKITDYADRLLNDLDKLDKWPESVKESQRNWIGRSEGAEFEFRIKDLEGDCIKVFTTRADTFFGVTYIVIAPEHSLVQEYLNKNLIKNKTEVEKYLQEVKSKSEIERGDIKREKTGVKLEGIFAIHPATGIDVPVWVADYVLASYGTGAVMAVPAHDERDFAFAKKYDLEIKKTELKNKEEIIAKYGKKVVKYRLKDWVFARQRYWGEPIPLVHCEKCGVVPVPEKELPLKLPKVKSYEPTDTGESPLAAITKWVNTKCPVCKSKAKRETNTMPQWAGSSWYYLRYMDNKNSKELVNKEKENYWSSVDLYVGGMEHATRHLIYARFWHKFLKDVGVVSTDEPFLELHNPGLIMGADGKKMSKRYGNVVDPETVVETFGADTFRLFLMFLGPFNQGANWSDEGIIGPRRFLERLYKLSFSMAHLQNEPSKVGQEKSKIALHKTMKKVTEDINNFSFNTSIPALMTCLKIFEEEGVSKEDFQKFLQILAPFAPHITEEIWREMGEKNSIHISTWPIYDPKYLIENSVKIGVQVNGKVRGEVEVEINEEEKSVLEKVRKISEIAKWIENKELKKVVYVKGKILNLIVS